MKILAQDSKKRWRTYKPSAHFDGSNPLRELIIQLLANCRIKKPFRLVFEKDEVIKIKQLLYYFFKQPFSRYGEIGTINDFFQFWLLADFQASLPGSFSVAPLLKGTSKDFEIVAELTIDCHDWKHMIGHAKYLLANRPDATKKDKEALAKWLL